MRSFDRLKPLALLALRVALGAILVAHGYSKVFGGHLHEHMGFVSKIGLPGWMGYLSAGTEFFGGILLILGLITRIVGIAVAIEMLVAILKVHLKNGLMGPGGFEFPMAVGVIAFSLIFLGAGPVSLDWVFGFGAPARKTEY